ncbi:MAG: Rne/Rng family ribonuclease [Moraxellaceae bacterium]
MKRILINATQNEEIRVALCTGNHLYDFDLENRTREQKKSNIYKGHVTRVEPSLEAVFVEYGSQRQGFLPIREISAEYLSGNPRDENIKKLIKEGDELIVQVEKEERGNKGAALSTYVSLAGRYLVLMPNNPRGGGISRQISGKLREDMKRMLSNLDLPKGMSVIIRTAGIGKTQEDLQHDLNHLLNIWNAIQEQNQKYPSPRLVHQEAGVVTRAVRDYLRDDIAEIWIDNENAYIEAAGFIDAVMPKQAEKLRKYTDYEPMFSRFNIEKQIETAYQREVRLPSGGSIVIDQTEALVSIDINSAKSTKGSDVAETAYHTNLEAADEIARQLRLRDMGGLIVIDFIDMNDNKHQKEVEKRLIDATKYDRARVQFGDISKFGLMEMSRQRLRPSLEESTGYICPRCHGNGMIRDLRSLSLSIMRQIEQIALKERQGEVQAEVPTDIAAFLLNEKRDSLVYLEQDSGTRITILPHAHLESPNFKLHFNRDGFAPSSYERITDTQQQEHSDLGYNVDWQTAEKERPEQQPTRQPRKATNDNKQNSAAQSQNNTVSHSNDCRNHKNANDAAPAHAAQASKAQSVAAPVAAQAQNAEASAQPKAVAWLSNLFAKAPQATTTPSVSSHDAAEAIEALVNTGAQSLGSFGQVNNDALSHTDAGSEQKAQQNHNQKNDNQSSDSQANRQQARRNNDSNTDDSNNEDRRRRKPRKSRNSKPRQRKETSDDTTNNASSHADTSTDEKSSDNKDKNQQDKRSQDKRRSSDRNRGDRQNSNRGSNESTEAEQENTPKADEQVRAKRKSHSQRGSRGKLERGETLTTENTKQDQQQEVKNNDTTTGKNQTSARRSQDPNEVVLQVNEAPTRLKASEVVHLSLDDSKAAKAKPHANDTQNATNGVAKHESTNDRAARPPANKPSDSKQSTDTKSDESNKKDAVETSNNQTHGDKETTAQAKVSDSASGHKQNAGDKDRSADIPSVSTHDTKSQSAAQETATVETATVESTSGKAQHQKSDTTEAIAKAEETKKTPVSDNGATETSMANSALELTHESLFGDRYVTAEKFGQASNDPRVVRAKQANVAQTPQAEIETQATTSATAIRGTVGEFIRGTLPDAQTRLAEEGVIGCFIATIALYAKQAKSADASSDVASVVNSSQNFDFSNYGYQPLAADYLARFDAMTQAVSQFAAAQGKTAVEPRAIGKRASNDPRGQHPDYEASATLDTTTEQASDSNEPEVEAEQSHAEVSAHDVEAGALANQAQADNVSADSEKLLEVEQAQSAANSVENQAGEGQETNTTAADATQVDVEKSDAEEAEQTTESKVEESAKETGKDDSQAAKSKTTIASYKNMIENVAEQLLPQTGMFNLTTPKVPKARSRKPKTDHKKPTQAEKLAADDTDSDS